MEKRKVSIIAMKGPPYTSKTAAASAIAESLCCPIFCIDDILNRLSPLHHHPTNSIPSPEEADRLYDLALDLICRTAKSLLDQGIVNSIVVDSRLHSQSQFNRLISLAGSFGRSESSVVIVECKPKCLYAWQMGFEESFVGPLNWYKPRSWDDMEKAILQDFDCDVLNLRSNSFSISKLVLDPFTSLRFLDLKENKKTPLFVEPVKLLMNRDKKNDPCVLDFDQWRLELYSSISHPRQMIKPLCRNGHSITNYKENGLGYEANCSACDEAIITDSAAYTCNSCCLALHKSCAEFSQTVDLSSVESFLENHSCSSCKQEEKEFSCESFLFQYNLKHRLMPTVINHEGHKHFLCLQFITVESFGHEIEFQCMACGLINVKDRACYCCKICGLSYELSCVNLPRQVMDEHGGYNHRTTLKYSSKEAEDYRCHNCLEKRDPRCWFYSCEECAYDTHLRCTC